MDKKTQQKLLNIVKQNYDDIADNFSATRYAVWPELKKIININDGDKILDLGCGNGRMLELLKNKNAHYTGVEQSKELAQYARKYADKNNIKNAKIITDNILNINKITKQKFDLILLIAVLPHIPSHEMRLQFLKQIKNHLKPNGQLIITCWDLRASTKHKQAIRQNNFKKILGLNKMDFNDIIFPWKNNAGQAMSPRYYHAFTIKNLKKILIQSDWQIEKIYTEDFFNEFKKNKERSIYAICKN